MEVSARNGDRFAIFNNEGINLCLYNAFHFSDPDGNPIEIAGNHKE